MIRRTESNIFSAEFGSSLAESQHKTVKILLISMNRYLSEACRAYMTNAEILDPRLEGWESKNSSSMAKLFGAAQKTTDGNAT